MTPDELMAEVAEAIETLLRLACKGAVHVGSQLTFPNNQPSISLVGQVSTADRNVLKAQGVDVALDTVAATIGAQTGVAEVSFQLG
jgi:hypothetical protein